MSYQPVLHGRRRCRSGRCCRPAAASGRRARRCRELACSAMSGHAALAAGIAVLPAGSVVWKSGRGNTWLKPPPESIQPISACPAGSGSCVGGSTLSTLASSSCRGLVQRYVPPTPVTSGSDAGHPTVGNGIGRAALAHRRLACVLAVPPSPDEASTVTSLVGRRLERVTQVLERLRAAERLLGRAEALRDHVGQVVVDDVLLGVHHLREALHAERLGGWRVDEQDVRPGRHRMRRLDVERDLERPRRLVLLAGAVALRRRRLRRRRALQRQQAERRHAGRAGHALLAAHRRQAERLVEDVQVVRHRVAAVGVDDRDRLAAAVEPGRVQRADVVRGARSTAA